MTGVSIVIPVGPNPAYKKYLPECFDSISEQTINEDEIFVIDDQAYLSDQDIGWFYGRGTVHHIKNAWLLGAASSWNVGIGISNNEWCIMMSSDDMLLPGALDACREIINNKADPLGWYNFTCEDSDGEQYSWYNNAAMISRKLWVATGGFPITASLGAPDALLISIMMVHFSDHLHKIKEGTPLYWVRSHPDQNGKQYAGVFNQQVIDVRNIETARWTKPEWTQNL